MEPRWLPLHTCRALRRSSQVCLSDTPLAPHHHEGAFKTICLLGEFFHGLLLQRRLLYYSLRINSPLPPSLFFFFKAHPWLNNQKKVTFLRSDFHACSMLGRHFRFPKTFHVTHSSTQGTAGTLYATMCTVSVAVMAAKQWEIKCNISQTIFVYFDVLWQWSMVFGLWINFIGIRKNNNIILLCTCDVTKCTATKQVFQISKEFV